MVDENPGAVARRLLMGFRATHLLYAMAELGVADHLAAGPRASADLAAELGAHPDALHRVLRALAQLGVLAQEPDGRFALTLVGATLRSDRPDSFRPVARFWGHPMMQRAWGDLLHTVRTGETAFEHAFGVPAFDYLDAHPEAAAVYNAGMARMRAAATAALPGDYDFARFGTIVDVGGGNGSTLAAILRAHPGPRGVVVDLAHARPAAEVVLAEAGLADRARFEPGDFFAAVPEGGDGYLLRQVLHDWDDDRAAAILRACRRAVPPHGRLLVIELLLPEAGEPGLDPSMLDPIMIDVTMLVRVGGRERTAAAYRALAERAGFRMERVVAPPGRHAILECTPA